MWSLTVTGVVVLCLVTAVIGLDNGLARTPAMGWMSWERFRCITDCKADPLNCISENLYKSMADRMAADGYRDAGYQYVSIDDCWMTKSRDKDGNLVADPERFPSGIKALADYIHSKGLKLGIYEDFGTETCGGYPGSKFYLEKDANLFASWGVDMLKLDGCYTETSDMQYGYPAMGFYLNQTGRPILYSCSWPAYVVFAKDVPDYKTIANNCNSWRNYADIDDSWASVAGIIDFYGDDKGNFSGVAGPGNFNDPDMIIVGDYGLSYDQEQSQMALWAVMAAPLFMSNDLRKITPQARFLLQNPRVIAINQDPLGIQGTRIIKLGSIQVWTRPVGPSGRSLAYVFLNTSQGGAPTNVTYSLDELGLKMADGYNVTEVFSGQSIGMFRPQEKHSVDVNPTGVYFGLASHN